MEENNYENSLPDFSRYNYEHQHQIAGKNPVVDPNEYNDGDFSGRRKMMIRIKLAAFFLVLTIIGSGIFFRTQIYDYFYYAYFYNESYTDLIPYGSENPSIESLMDKNAMAYALYKDKSKSREDVILELKLRGRMLKEAFKIYTYEQLTPVIEDPKILALSNNPNYSPYIERVVAKKGVLDFTKIGLASAENILGDNAIKPEDVNASQASKFVLYNKDSGEFYNLYSPTLNTDEVRRFSGFIVLSDGILIDDEMLVSDIYKINPNETGVLGLNIPSRNLTAATIIVRNSSESKKRFAKNLDDKSSIHEMVNVSVNRYLSQYSQSSFKVNATTYAIDADPVIYCQLSLPKKAAYALSKLNLENRKTIDVVSLLDICDNNFGTGFAPGSGRVTIPMYDGVNLSAYAFEISGNRVSLEKDLASKIYIQKLLRSMGVLGSAAIENKSCLTELGQSACKFDAPDSFDIMSSGSNLSSPKRHYLNLFDQTQIKNITLSGTYDIYPLDVALDNVSKVIILHNIKSPFSKSDIDDSLYYYVENRANVGIQVRLASKKYPLFDDFSSIFVSGNLNPGNDYFDPVNKIRIKALDGNKISVSLEKTEADDLVKPSVTLKIASKNQLSSLVDSIEVKSTAFDNKAILSHELKFNGQTKDCKSEISCTLNIDTLTLFDNKPYDVVATVTDTSGNKVVKTTSFLANNGAKLTAPINKYKVTYYSKLNFLGQSKSKIIDKLGIDLDTVYRAGFDKAKFAAVFEGQVSLAGFYALQLKSNNPVRIWINNSIVVNEVTIGKNNQYNRTVSLDRKVNNLRIEYLSDGSNLPPELSLSFAKANESEYQDQKIKDKEEEKPVSSEPDVTILMPTQIIQGSGKTLPTSIPDDLIPSVLISTPTPSPTKVVAPMVIIGPKLLTPVNNSTLSGAIVSFSWTIGTGVDEYRLVINKDPNGFGSNDIAAVSLTGITTTINNLPTDGSMLYARLYYRSGAVWSYDDYTFRSYNSPNVDNATAATMISPVHGTMLSSKDITFTWGNGKLIKNYGIKIGKSISSGEYYSNDSIASNQSSLAVNVIPQDGSSVYVSLISNFTDSTGAKEIRYMYSTKNQYATTTEVVVRARGESNDDFPPKLTLKIAGNTYETKNISKSEAYSEYIFKANYVLSSIMEVILEFTNDMSDPITPTMERSTIDRNIYIEWVRVNGKVYPLTSTNSSIVYDRANPKTGTYTGYPSFGSNSDCIGLLRYNDNLGFDGRKFLGEIFWKGSIRIKDNICK